MAALIAVKPGRRSDHGGPVDVDLRLKSILPEILTAFPERLMT